MSHSPRRLPRVCECHMGGAEAQGFLPRVCRGGQRSRLKLRSEAAVRWGGRRRQKGN